MTALTRAELLKARTTWTVPGLFLGTVGLVLLAVALHGGSLPARDLLTRADQMRVFGWVRFAALFAGLAGALSITGEIRHGTARPTFLATPRRARVVAAKAVVGLPIGLLFGLAAEAVALGVGVGALSARGIDIRLRGGDVALLLVGGAVACALWTAVGLGLGALVREQVPALVGIAVWVVVVENLLVEYVPAVGRLMPGAAAVAASGQDSADLLPPAAGLLLLGGYAAVAVAVAALATVRRDVA